MKAKLFIAIISTSLLLSACGGDHAHPKAVDKLEEAETNAKANAPKAEEVKFDDHGQPTMGGVGGASGAVAPTTTDTATTDVAETTPATPETAETAKPASTETTETMAVAEAPAPAETAKAEETAPTDTETKQ